MINIYWEKGRREGDIGLDEGPQHCLTLASNLEFIDRTDASDPQRTTAQLFTNWLRLTVSSQVLDCVGLQQLWVGFILPPQHSQLFCSYQLSIKSLFPPEPIQSPPTTHTHPSVSHLMAEDKMKARAGGILFYFSHLFRNSDTTAGESSVECNLFMVMAWEKGAGAKLFCPAMLESERSQSNVLITEMTRDVIERAKRWKIAFFFSPTSEEDVSHFSCSC